MYTELKKFCLSLEYYDYYNNNKSDQREKDKCE